MQVRPIEPASVRLPAPPRAGSVRHEPGVVERDDHPEVASRLSMVVELIQRITGREVRMVPPAAYFVSAPPLEQPDREPPELVVVADLTKVTGEREDPMVVDVSAVLGRSTTERLILDIDEGGRAALFPGLSLQL